jgi:hypothetical protein
VDDEEDDIVDIWTAVRAPPRPKLYIGYRSQQDGKCHVDTVERGEIKPLSGDVGSFAFEWGYLGDGPTLLAREILRDHFGKGREGRMHATRLHQQFRIVCIAKLPHAGWQMTNDDVAQHVKDIEPQVGDPDPQLEKEPSKTRANDPQT